ncbi:MFS transporter [Aeromicrobium sp.]|uniref:MFS transporter n=1 Tax=Aeromicrobium sp. TaxID=1871063 RepID=UPI002FCBBD39
MTAPASTSERLWLGPHGRVVAGIFSLAFLVAFESLAVMTVMPVVADELDGLGLYALTFAAPTAVAVVSMTIAGPLMDRRGPGLALRAGVGIFAAGLLVSGLAPTMEVFLVGRAVQGLGMGFVGVGLYVVIGKVFPEHMRARVFTVMTSAWVLPALVGPVIAGFIADHIGWRWVFLSVPLIAIGSLLLIWEALGRLDGNPAVGSDRRRLWWASLTAGGILTVSVAGQRGVGWWPVLLIVALALIVAYAPRLLPRGTWRGHRGLPSVIATRSLLSAGFFGAETYVPLSLVENRGLNVSQAGLLLTSAAVLWFSGSWIAANVPALASKTLRVRLGTGFVLLGTGSGFLTLTDGIPVLVIAGLWSVGGLGMGLAASTLGVLLLDHSAPGEQGANSAAMQTSDAVVQSLVLAIGSVVFAVMLQTHELTGYILVFGLASVVGMFAVALATRID